MEDERTKAPNVSDQRAKVTGVWAGGFASATLPERGSITIGRGDTCELVLRDATVSRKHALLHVAADTLEIEDLDSANGTLVGGRRIAPRVRVAVAGATIEIGSVPLVVQDARAETNDATSGGMDAVLTLVDRVAASAITVLLLGETGVGKGVLAERLHAKSARRDAPFLAINCSALADTLLESELFGHERGAFTGAFAAHAGLLESAQGGTLFLDEIGEIPPSTQVKLLRALENREVLRVGGRKPIVIDVRFVAATNRDLPSLVADGRFRADLFYRLNGIVVRVPPLRDRKNEIVELAERFATDGGRKLRIAPSAIARLRAHGWPGNVRELRNVIERAVVLARDDDEIRPEHLLLEEEHGAVSLRESKGDVERERIERALSDAGGNQTRAASLLGISRRTLLRRLDDLAFPRPRKT